MHKDAILVDDGVATGLSLRAGVMEIRDQNPQKIVVASPIIPDGAYSDLKRIVDEVVALVKPDKDEFLGSVGSYYSTFPQVTDAEVIYLLNNHEETQMNKDIKKVLEATARW